MLHYDENNDNDDVEIVKAFCDNFVIKIWKILTLTTIEWAFYRLAYRLIMKNWWHACTGSYFKVTKSLHTVHVHLLISIIYLAIYPLMHLPHDYTNSLLMTLPMPTGNFSREKNFFFGFLLLVYDKEG